MHTKDRIAASKTAFGVFATLSMLLAGCDQLMQDKIASAAIGTRDGTGGFNQVVVQGNVGDGPVTNSSIVVTTIDGITIWEGPSGTDAGYVATLLVLPDDYPLFIGASGGTDLVTGNAPDLTMESPVIDDMVTVSNINPYSTVILETASQHSSGVTSTTVNWASDVVVQRLNFGLDLNRFRDPIKTPVQPSNVATVIRSGSALSEMFRRTSTVLAAAGLALSPNAVLAHVAGDMTDGVLDGRGPGANARVAATANIVSAQVALETMTNTLRIDSMLATSRIDSAIAMVEPNASTMVSGLTATPHILAQAEITVAAAYDLVESTALADLLINLNTVPDQASVSTARQRLPQNPGTLLDAAIEAIKFGNSADFETVNSRVRSGLVPEVPDTIAPVISLLGPNTVQLTVGDPYVEHGATANDDRDGNISAQIDINDSDVDTSQPGNYVVMYNVADAAGNAATQRVRAVAVTAAPVIDTEAPVISLNGANPLNLVVGDTYVEPGATAIDNVDGNISNRISINNNGVTTSTAGTYQVTYNVSDTAGNRANQIIRSVVVSALPVTDTVRPVIILLGANPLQLTVGNSYVEPGATATDNVDGNIASRISISGSVNTNIAGTYTVRYNVSDSAGNAANQVTRSVNVTVPSGGSSGRPWEAVLSEVVGYAKYFGVTGGSGKPLLTVTNLNDSGSGSLRQAIADASNGGSWIRFAKGLSGTIRLNSALGLVRDTTIDGRGADITIIGPGASSSVFSAGRGDQNWILMYLKLVGPVASNNDILSVQNGTSSNPLATDSAEKFWVYHVSFNDSEDELVSFIRTEGKYTVQNSYFRNNSAGNTGYCALISHGTESNYGWEAIVHKGTWARNHFNQCKDRMPYITVPSNIHIYNSYYYDWAASGIHVTARFDATLAAQLRFEGNIATAERHDQLVKPTLSRAIDGDARLDGNLFLNGAFGAERNRTSVFTPPYQYVAQSANSALRDTIVGQAGWQNVVFPE